MANNVLSRNVPPQFWAALGVIALLAVGWFFGSYHIMQSEEGTKIIKKIHFTYSETFTSLEAITGMPGGAAQVKYPLSIKALQRDDILESDEERDQRIEEEVEQDMSRRMRDAEREMNQRMRDIRSSY
jgi:hypothetical protein